MTHDAALPRETGQRVRDARKHRNLPRRSVAVNAGFSTHELAAAERGRRALTVDELRSLAGSIGVELDALLPDGCSVEAIPPADEVRIEDLLTPVAASPELEAALGSSARGVDAPEFVERRRAPIASTQLNRAFEDLRARIADVSQCCARLHAADADDDVAALLADLHVAVTALDRDPAFAEALTRHTSAREDYSQTAQEAEQQSWRNRTPGAPRPVRN